MQDTPATQTTDLTPEGNAKLAWADIKARALAGDAEAIAQIETLQTLFHGGPMDHVLGYVCKGEVPQFGVGASPTSLEGRGKKEEDSTTKDAKSTEDGLEVCDEFGRDPWFDTEISLNSDTIHDAKAPADLSLQAGAVSFPTNGVIEGSSEAGAGLEGSASADAAEEEDLATESTENTDWNGVFTGVPFEIPADSPINLSEVAALLRVGHNVLPDLVKRWGEMEKRLSTIDESLDRAERRHVLQAWTLLRGKYPDAGAGVVEDAVERWRLGEVSMKELEEELEGKGKEDQVDEVDTADEESPEPQAEQVKSMWLADYDPATDLATWTTLTLMAQPTDTARHAIINRVEAMGGNAAPLYAINGGDFKHTPHREVFYDGSDKAKGEWLVWYQHMINLGIEPWVFLMNDDEPHPQLDRKNLAAVKAYWKRLIRDIFEPLRIRHVSPGLEALEYWTPDELNELGSWLKAEMPWAEIGMHTLERDPRCLGESWVDAIWWQGTFWAPWDAYRADLGALRNQWPEKKIYLMEYSKEGTTDAAQALGNAALAWGCAGVLNGWGTGGTPTAGHPDTRTKATTTGQWKATPTHQPWDIGSGVKLLGPVTHPFDSAWRETIRLDGIEVFGGKIRFPFHRAGAWQTITQPDGSTSVGHLWVMQLVSGQFYASTIDWLRSADQQSKDFPGVMLGNHLLAPMGLKSGESYGFFISTVARNGKRTTDERSNVVWVRLDEG